MMPHNRALSALWMAVVTLLGFALRSHQLGAQSFWFDEGWSWHVASSAWPDMLSILRTIDSHPPLYYALLKVWMALAGSSDVSLRLVSALAGAAAIPLVYALSQRWFRDRALAMVAALWLACNPAHVFYSQETRMYALAVFFAGMAVYGAWRWLAAQRARTLVGYALAALAVLYTNYFGAFVIIAVNLALPLGLWGGRNRLRRLKQWWGAQLIVALCLLPLTPLGQGLLSHDFAWRPTLSTEALLFDAWRAVTVGSSPWRWQPEAWEPIAWALPLIGAVALLRRRPVSALSTAWYALVPVALMALLELNRAVYTGRYVLYVVVPLAVLVAAGAVALGRMAAWVVRQWRPLSALSLLTGLSLAGLALMLAFGAPFADGLRRYYLDPTYARDDFRAVAAHIQGQEKPGEAIILLNTAYPFRRYYTGQLPHLTLPFDLDHVRDEAEVVSALTNVVRAPARVWVVEWQWEIADPQGFVHTQLRLHGGEAGQQWFWAGEPQWPIRVVAFDLTSDDFQLTPRHALDVTFESGAIRLTGYHVQGRAVPGERVFVTLWWQLAARPARQYHVFTHLVKEASAAPLVAGSDKPPLNDYYPFRVWPLGQTVQDAYIIEIPREAEPPPYALRVGLYDPETGARLDAEQNGRIIGDGVTLLTLAP
jgi:hypothetical protein